MIREFHLFAGIGGGIYGGELLGHRCCAGVEISAFCQNVLRQKQKDGWLPEFPLYGDITKLNGGEFKGTFDVLCGGFPCQAFSHAAHGKNIPEKNLWDEMYRFCSESEAPVVFGENVTLKAIEKAKADLENIGYEVKRCKLSCGNLGADHRRDRYWLLAVKDKSVLLKLAEHDRALPPISSDCWAKSPQEVGQAYEVINRREQLKGVGNAQSPMVAASAFRILVNRHIEKRHNNVIVSDAEIEEVFKKGQTWIRREFGTDFGFVHTPTTMANYSAPSMMKHQGCRNFKKVFDRPTPANAEYLMGFPQGASSPQSLSKENIIEWVKLSLKG